MCPITASASSLHHVGSATCHGRVSLLISLKYSMLYSVSTGGCEAAIARYEVTSGARRRRGRADAAGVVDIEGGPTGPETLRYHMMQTRRSS